MGFGAVGFSSGLASGDRDVDLERVRGGDPEERDDRECEREREREGDLSRLWWLWLWLW